MENSTAELFAAALKEIDAAIAAAEAQVADLIAKRKNTEELKAFFETPAIYSVAQASMDLGKVPEPAGPVDDRPRRGWGDNSHHAVVRELIRRRALTTFHTRDVVQIADEEHLGLTARQISNALSRLRVDGVIDSLPSRGKGYWKTVTEDTNGPAEARPFALAPSPSRAGVGVGSG